MHVVQVLFFSMQIMVQSCDILKVRYIQITMQKMQPLKEPLWWQANGPFRKEKKAFCAVCLSHDS